MREYLVEVNWSAHFPEILRFVSTLTMLGLALYYNIGQYGQLQRAENSQRSQALSNDDAVLSYSLLQDHGPRFRELAQPGVVGETQRLQWIETLKQLGNAHQIPAVAFSLSATRNTSQLGDPYWHQEIPVEVTGMSLNLNLTHEGEFYRLMSELREQAPGKFTMDNCSIDWRTDESGDLRSASMVSTCKLSWYTLSDITDNWESRP